MLNSKTVNTVCVLPALVIAIMSAAASADTTETILSLDADTEYGEYLAGECTTCHNVQQTLGEKGDSGVPGIHGATRESLISDLLAYRSGEKDNTTMQGVTQSKTDEEIAALAAYFVSFSTSETEESQQQDQAQQQTDINKEGEDPSRLKDDQS